MARGMRGAGRWARVSRCGSSKARGLARVVAHAGHDHEHGGAVAAGDTEAFLDSLKYDANGLVCAIAQCVDTGAIQMQAFASREAVRATLETGNATFWSRSRQALWCKGETSGNFIKVHSVHVDCDRDSLIYMGVPIGPSCHTGAQTCYYTRVDGEHGLLGGMDGRNPQDAAVSTLFQLKDTIAARDADPPPADGSKPSWTKRLLDNPELLCKKVREEAGEFCETLENDEGKERAASEAADALYHGMVLLHKLGVEPQEVLEVLRGRFGVSGVAEKAARGGGMASVEE